MKNRITILFSAGIVLIALAVITVSCRYPDDGCKRLNRRLAEKVMEKSKQSPTDSTVRIIGCNENNASFIAGKFCAELNAKKMDIDASEKVYLLPNNLGSLILEETCNDSVFLKISLATACEDILFKEIEYVSFEYYDKAGKDLSIPHLK